MNSNHLPVSGGLAVFIAVVVSYFVIDPAALDSVRPGGEEIDVLQVQGIENVQARLWQDPFAAARAHQQTYHKGEDGFSGDVQIKTLKPNRTATLSLKLSPLTGKGESGKGMADPHALDALITQSSVEAEESKHRVNVLAVMVPGGPYPDDGEIRLRKRYAVIAGLAASGYQPLSEAHIGYVNDLGESRCSDEHFGEGQMPATMPFEWFKNAKSDQYTLLLWLDEDAFAHHPLCKLNYLFKNGQAAQDAVIFEAEKKLDKIRDEGRRPTKKEQNEAYNEATTLVKTGHDAAYPVATTWQQLGRVSIIGPHGSGTLKAMISELKRPKETLPNLKGTVFFSATATAASKTLMPDHNVDVSKQPDHETKLKDPVAEEFLKKQIVFFRTIANDRELTDALVKEIKTRLHDKNHCLQMNNFKVALISEWDTLYGRSLPETFIDSAFHYYEGEKKSDCDSEKNNKQNRKQWAQDHIYRFSYLRGIDGVMASDKKNTGNDRSQDQTDHGASQTSSIELAEGTSQKDYLRRLAADMALTHQKLKNEGNKGIRAIGVLGSDVYDKLLVLRALRKQFPKAIFFTTDLDAALLHPDQFPWTRNLLVASSFDLKIASYSDIQSMLRKQQESENMLCKQQKSESMLRKQQKSENMLCKQQKSEKGGQSVGYLKMLLNATERTIPQNRDAYQTSIFLSCIFASNEELFANFWAIGNTKDDADYKKLFIMQARYQYLHDKRMRLEQDKQHIKPAEAHTLIRLITDKLSSAWASEDEKKVLRKEKKALEQQMQKQELGEGQTQSLNGKYVWHALINPMIYLDAWNYARKKLDPKNHSIRYAVFQQGFYDSFGKHVRPRVYEIGRSKTVDLYAIDHPGENNPFFPRKVDSLSRHTLKMVATGIIIFVMLTFLFWHRWIMHSADIDDDVFRRADYIAVGVSIVAVLVLYLGTVFKASIYTFHTFYTLLFTDYVLLALVYAGLVCFVIRFKTAENGALPEGHKQ